MKLIDTHAHLLIESYGNELEEKIISLEKKFNYIFNIAWNLETSKEVISLSKKFPFLKPTVGVHPNDSTNVSWKDVEEAKELVALNKNIIAIGEIGLDFYREKSSPQKQKEVFIWFLNIARDLKMPVIIHTRDSIMETFEILKDYKDLKMLVHSWSGNVEQTKKYLETFENILFSFNGILTYKNANEIRVVFKQIPKERIVFETDAPWLTPEPNRGKQNSPENIIHIFEFASKLWNMNVEEVLKICDVNVKKFFNV